MLDCVLNPCGVFRCKTLFVTYKLYHLPKACDCRVIVADFLDCVFTCSFVLVQLALLCKFYQKSYINRPMRVTSIFLFVWMVLCVRKVLNLFELNKSYSCILYQSQLGLMQPCIKLLGIISLE